MTVHPPRDRELTLEPVSSVIRDALHRFDQSVVRGFVPTATTEVPGVNRSGVEAAWTPAISVVGGGSMVIFRTSDAIEEDIDAGHPGVALSGIRRQLEAGHLPQVSSALLEAADSALLRLQGRQDEDVEEWARRLAEDVARPND